MRTISIDSLGTESYSLKDHAIDEASLVISDLPRWVVPTGIAAYVIIGIASLAAVVLGPMAMARAISAAGVGSSANSALTASVLKLGTAAAYLMGVPVVNITLAGLAFAKSQQL